MSQADGIEVLQGLKDRIDEELSARKGRDAAAHLVQSEAFWNEFWAQVRTTLFRTARGIGAGLVALVSFIGGVLSILAFFFD